MCTNGGGVAQTTNTSEQTSGNNTTLTSVANLHTKFKSSLLIGADHYWDVVEDKIVRGSGPTAAKSKIGYLLFGPTAIPYPPSALTATVLKAIVATEREEETLERFWNLESIGILPDETEKKKEREFVEDYQNSSIRLENGHYNAKLPWKPDHPPLPTNEAIAKGRTHSTVRRLATDPEKLKAYNQIITEQQQRGFIEKSPITTRSEADVTTFHTMLS